MHISFKLIPSLFLLIPFAVWNSNCKSTKNIQTAISKKDTIVTKINMNDHTNEDSIKLVNETLEKINLNKIDFTSFSAKVKVEYDAEGQNVPDVIANIRIRKDSIIWINIEKLFLNVARVMITKDSFFLLNKLEKTIQRKPLSYMQEITQIGFDFQTIQDLLVGNPVYFEKPISTFKKNETTTSILTIGSLFKNLITIRNSNYLVQHCKLDDVDINRNRTCDLSYGDYELKDTRNFSKDRTIVVSEKSKLQIDLKFKQFTFNELLNFPFTIPKNYKIAD
jgi:hypothetical protein